MAHVHEPVLCKEAITLLNCRQGGMYVDGTVGDGGHALYLLRHHPLIDRLVAIDRDEEALKRARIRLSTFAEKCFFAQGSFADIAAILASLHRDRVDGILLDLGISSYQLKEADRGFSFSLNGALDMRMDRRQPTTAADLVNTLSKKSLVRILREYGEEKWAAAIAGRIIEKRKAAPIAGTRELADIVSASIPRRAHPRKIHPATRTFQALRIAVNEELAHLEKGLEQSIHLLAPGGRIAVIAFHSLEDRIVKNSFRFHARACICPPRMPECRCGHRATVKELTRKPIVPASAEIDRNPLARSARLRAAEKLPT